MIINPEIEQIIDIAIKEIIDQSGCKLSASYKDGLLVMKCEDDNIIVQVLQTILERLHQAGYENTSLKWLQQLPLNYLAYFDHS